MILEILQLGRVCKVYVVYSCDAGLSEKTPII
jgi:hypothetical protein